MHTHNHRIVFVDKSSSFLIVFGMCYLFDLTFQFVRFSALCFVAYMRFDNIGRPFFHKSELKPKKFRIAFFQIDDFRFFFTDFQLQPLLKPCLRCMICSVGIFSGSAKYLKIVSVSYHVHLF